MLYNTILEPVSFDVLPIWIEGNYGRFLWDENCTSSDQIKEVLEVLSSEKARLDFFSAWISCILQNIDPSNDLVVDIIDLSQDLEEFANRYGFYNQPEKARLLLVSQQSSNIPLFFILSQTDQILEKELEAILHQALLLGLEPEEILVHGAGFHPGQSLFFKEGKACQIDYFEMLGQSEQIDEAISAMNDLVLPEHLYSYRDRYGYLTPIQAFDKIELDPKAFLYAGLDLSPFYDEQDFLLTMALRNTFGPNEIKQSLDLGFALALACSKEIAPEKLFSLLVYRQIWPFVFMITPLLFRVESQDYSINTLKSLLLLTFMACAIKSLMQYQLGCTQSFLERSLFNLYHQHAITRKSSLKIEPAQNPGKKLYKFFEIEPPKTLALKNGKPVFKQQQTRAKK